MIERRNAQLQHTETLNGIVASKIHNSIRNVAIGLVGEATVPADFMPSLWKTVKPKKKRINRKQIAKTVDIFLTAQANARNGAIK